MYIWVGIDVDSQLREIEALSLKAREEIGCAPPDFTLPLHVSLKISFEVPDREVERVVRDIENIYRESGAFIMKVRGIEYCEVITCRQRIFKKRLDTQCLTERLRSTVEYAKRYGFLRL